MKFHCDRCKTRYSISAERVRGKILKIRCKNCSAVITVREGMDEGAAPAAGLRSPQRASSPRRASSPSLRRASSPSPQRASSPSPQRPALAGAFASALERQRDPGASDSLSAAPASLEAEWYVAVDGDQHGPLSLEAARAWIRARPSDDEVFCWSEGFDDWLRVEKVSHFRGLPRTGDDVDDDERTVIDPGARLAPGVGAAPGAGSPRAGLAEETPKPLFAATMAAVEAEAPTVAEDEALPDPLAPKVPASEKNGAGRGLPPVDEVGCDLDFDIGEASRVVNLPLLARQLGDARSGAAAAADRADLPGMRGAPALGRGSGSETALGAVSAAPESAAGAAAAPILQPARRRGLMLPLAIGGAVLIAAVAILVIVMLGGDDVGDRSTIARGSVGGGGNLGYTFTEKARGAASAAEASEAEGGRPGTTAAGGAARGPRAAGGRRQASAARTGTAAPRGGSGEVDLSGGGDRSAAGPLDGDDLMKVYRSNQYLMKRCYERALKKDPFLEVSKTWVSITVSKTGKVTTVSIPTLEGSELGSCLTSIIRRWKFRTSSEVFNTRFPVVFGS